MIILKKKKKKKNDQLGTHHDQLSYQIYESLTHIGINSFIKLIT